MLTYMGMISEVDDEGSGDRLNSDPGVATITGGLKAADEVLKQEGDGAGISVAFDSEREIRAGAFWVEIDHYLLLHFHACLSQSFLL